ncbi:Arm DNA-binding domain-containing protein [Herbaspirillum sp. ST 5-3]|uniref:Arm DNA-binding domain-containing protein n=1 Tax=Oxalobacteraceae TaxID=75682 RepID=UPI0010A4B0C2|nr:Arm DNA-binding domain-containing protein [Herbaspirillum sp. ST 5-3]
MPKLAIPLTDANVQAAVPRDNPFKIGDGGGLYLYVQPSGSRSWYMSYRRLGKQRRLVLGAYPGVSLAMARTARDRIRRLLAEGKDPAVVLREERMRERERQAAGRTFRLALNEAGELTIDKPHSCMRLNASQVGALRAFLIATNDEGNSQGE